MSDSPCWPWATTAQDFEMADEPRMSVLSSAPLCCSHSVTSRRRGGGALGTDFSAACAPDSPAAYVLVLSLPGGSPIPCGVSVVKGDLFGWALLARASTLSSLRPCGTCPPLLQKPSASLFQALALLQCLRCQSPAHLLSCCVLREHPFTAKGPRCSSRGCPGILTQERTRTVGWDHWYGTYDMHVVTVDTWNHELG